MNLTVAFMRAVRSLMPPDVTDGVVTVTRAGDQVSIALTIAGAERPLVSATGRRQRVADARQTELFNDTAATTPSNVTAAPFVVDDGPDSRAPVAQAPAESTYVLLCTPKGTGGYYDGISWAARFGMLWFGDPAGALYWHSEGGAGKGWNETQMVTSIARRDLPAVLAAAERAELVLTINDLPNHTGDSMLRDGAVVRLADGTSREVIGVEADTKRVKLSDYGITNELHALSALETATDGSGVFRLVTSPSQRAKKHREKAATKKRTEITAESLRGVQRVRVRQSMAGISGVPVTLAGEPVTVMSVGPKRVKVRTDGEGRTHSIPIAAVELLSEEP